MNTFEKSDEYARIIMELPFITSLPQVDQDKLSHLLAKYRKRVLEDIEMSLARTMGQLRLGADNYVM